MTVETLSEREKSSKLDFYLWLFIVITTTVVAFQINILSIRLGGSDIAAFLLYIPIVIAAYWYTHRGVIFTVAVAALYIGMEYMFHVGNAAGLSDAVAKSIVLVGVAVVVSTLGLYMRQNELKYLGIFDNSQAGIGLIKRSDLSFTDVNQRFATILGHTPSELFSRSFSSLWVDPADQDRFFNLLNNNKRVDNFETRLLSKGRGHRWILMSAGIFPNNQFVCTLVDITDRKQAEEALLIKDHAIRSSINAVAILDLSLLITYVNQSLVKIMAGENEKQFIGKNFGNFISTKEKVEEITESVFSNGSWFREIVIQKYDGTPFYALVWINLVKDETGEAICIMVSFIDITDRKQMEMVKRKALEQIERNIEQFAVLSDTIRNPLAVIVGLSSMAPGDITDTIMFQAREIDNIITQLDMGWIESEKVREFIKRYYGVGSQVLAGESDTK